MKKRTLAIVGTIVVIAVVLIIVAWMARKNGEADGQFRTARVERDDIVVKVTESGEVAPLTVVSVKSELAGEVKQLFVEEGDSVEGGEKLALVQQESSQAQQIAQARASVERARIDLEDAELNLKRQQELYDKGFIAKKDVEDAEQEYRLSEIQYQLSEKQLWVVLGGETDQPEPGMLGTKAFDNITVTAPIAGVVISLEVEEGEMITSGTQAYGGGGTVLMTIADLSKMIVTTDVNEVDVGKISVGQPAQIGFDAIRNRVYAGVVKKIAPAGTVEGNVVVFPVEVEIMGSVSGEFHNSDSGSSSGMPGGSPLSELPEDQREDLRRRIDDLRAQGADREEIRSVIEEVLAEHGKTAGAGAHPEPPAGPLKDEGVDQSAIALIKPGMTADLDIIIARAQAVLCVPREAVMERDGGNVVMLLEDGKAVSHPVVTGLEDDVKVEVKEGLQEGDQVILVGEQSTFSQQEQSRQRSPRGGPPM